MFGVYLSTERSGFEMISLGIEYFIFIFFFLVNSEIDVNLIFLTLEVICCSCFMPEGMSRCNKNQAFLPCGSFLKEVIEFDSRSGEEIVIAGCNTFSLCTGDCI